jgi:hypothetical protein
MGAVVTTFVYRSVEEALHFSSYYSDLLNSYKNTFDSVIMSDGEYWTLEFKIHDTSRGQNNSGDSEGTRYLSDTSSEDS